MKNYHSTVIGFAVLIVLLGAGAAQGLSGTNTVDSGDIVNSTIVGADVKDNSLNGADIKTGRDTYGEEYTFAGNELQFGTADCPSGKHLSGGGFTQGDAALEITDSYPLDSNTWIVYAQNRTSSEAGITVFAICDGL